MLNNYYTFVCCYLKELEEPAVGDDGEGDVAHHPAGPVDGQLLVVHQVHDGHQTVSGANRREHVQHKLPVTHSTGLISAATNRHSLKILRGMLNFAYFSLELGCT